MCAGQEIKTDLPQMQESFSPFISISKIFILHEDDVKCAGFMVIEDPWQNRTDWLTDS